MEFVNYVVRNNVKHAGIVLLPTGWEIGTLTFASAGVAGSMRGLIERNGRSYVNNKI